MKIIHYHPRALVGDGGVSNSVRYLSRALADAGAEAVIAYDAADGAPPSDDGVQWVPVRHTGLGEVRVPLDMDRVLTGGGVLVLNSAWTVHNERAGAVARGAGVPYIVAPRGAYDPLILRRRARLKRAWWTLAEGRLVRGAAAVHVFFAEQEEHVRQLGYPGRIVVAPNGITVPPDVTWDGGSGGYLLYLGRFDPEHKGLDQLLAAVAGLPDDQRRPLRLVGPDWKGGHEVVLGQIARLGLEPWVTTAPAAYGDEKWDLLRRAAGFVYPSRWEGFGNSLAEAAAIGLPSLATPYPLATHLAGRGATIVVAPHDLGRGIQTLLGAPPMAAALAEQLRQEFTWGGVARRWLEQVSDMASASP